jgi:predicted secreted Zn-dependent protease
MRESVRHRFASSPARYAALGAALVSLTGCPGASPLQDAHATPAALHSASRGTAGAGAQTATPGYGVRVDVQVHYYDVAGRSVADLLAAMQRLGPAWGERRFFGLTNTALEYGYRHVYGSGWCSVREPSVLAEVRVTLPRWRHPQGTPYALERDWRAFERALTSHEEGHVRLAREEASTLYRQISVLRAHDCAAIDRDAGLISSELRNRFALRHAEYDRRTDHGRSQGAAWPRE